MNKPLVVVCNKTDLQPLEGISEEDTKLVVEMKAEAVKTVLGQGGEPTDDEGGPSDHEHLDRGWSDCCEQCSLR
ncbi:hypothetical protein CDL15_Pgr018561 [Punica granatum]|nr:hypothetical protein CDL15_Pgr018561 [Punica granatum]